MVKVAQPTTKKMKLALNTDFHYFSNAFVNPYEVFSVLKAGYFSVKDSKGQQQLLTVPAWRVNVLAVFTAGTTCQRIPAMAAQQSSILAHLVKQWRRAQDKLCQMWEIDSEVSLSRMEEWNN